MDGRKNSKIMNSRKRNEGNICEKFREVVMIEGKE